MCELAAGMSGMLDVAEAVAVMRKVNALLARNRPKEPGGKAAPIARATQDKST